MRKHALLGLLLGCAGVIGLWSVGFFTFDLIRFVQRQPVTTRVYHERARKRPSARGDHTRAERLDALLAEPSPVPATNLPPELAEVRGRIEQRRQRAAHAGGAATRRLP